jgi:predicted methyltransferase
VLKSEVDDLQLEKDSLDAALIVMAYHDLYYYNPDRGWGNTDIPLFFSQIHDALRAGGKLMIIDHVAEAGSGKSAAGTVHRIAEEFTRQEVESNGFHFVASSDALRNPDDDYSKVVFDKAVRGTTDRFVMLFAKD